MPQDPKKKKSAVRSSKPLDTSPKPNAKRESDDKRSKRWSDELKRRIEADDKRSKRYSAELKRRYEADDKRSRAMSKKKK